MSLAKNLFRALPALACVLLCGTLPVGAATLDITGPPGATVVVNDMELGALPLDGPLELAPGRYRVESRLTGYVAFSQLVHLEQEDAHLHVQVRLSRLSKGTAWRSNVLFAGLGQFYTGKRFRGWLYAGAETAGLVTALVGEWQRSDYRKDYLRILEDYNSQINQFEAERLRAEADDAYANMEDAASMRDKGLIVAVSAIAVSIVDVLITFPHVAAGPGPVPPTMGYLEGVDQHDLLTSVHAGVRLTF